MFRSKKVREGEEERVKAFIPIFITGIVFWTMVLQLFTTFVVYADTRVDLIIAGYTTRAADISTFEVIAGIIAGPLIAAYGQRMAAHAERRAPSLLSKLSLGIILMTATFILFATFLMLFTGQIPIIPVIIGMIVMGVTEVM